MGRHSRVPDVVPGLRPTDAGLQFTSSSRAGFITGLTVVFVQLGQACFFRAWPSPDQRQASDFQSPGWHYSRPEPVIRPRSLWAIC